MKSSKGIQKNIKDIAPFFHLTEMEGFSNRINHSFKFVNFVQFCTVVHFVQNGYFHCAIMTHVNVSMSREKVRTKRELKY